MSKRVQLILKRASGSSEFRLRVLRLAGNAHVRGRLAFDAYRNVFKTVSVSCIIGELIFFSHDVVAEQALCVQHYFSFAAHIRAVFLSPVLQLVAALSNPV